MNQTVTTRTSEKFTIAGPPLPEPLHSTTVHSIGSPATRLIVLGGYGGRGKSVNSNKVYELTCGEKIGCGWKTKDWQLDDGRSMHVSFLMTEVEILCSGPAYTTEEGNECDLEDSRSGADCDTYSGKIVTEPITKLDKKKLCYKKYMSIGFTLFDLC